MRIHYTVLAILEISIIVKSELNFIEWTDPLKKKKKKEFCECLNGNVYTYIFIQNNSFK